MWEGVTICQGALGGGGEEGQVPPGKELLYMTRRQASKVGEADASTTLQVWGGFGPDHTVPSTTRPLTGTYSYLLAYLLTPSAGVHHTSALGKPEATWDLGETGNGIDGCSGDALTSILMLGIPCTLGGTAAGDALPLVSRSEASRCDAVGRGAVGAGVGRAMGGVTVPARKEAAGPSAAASSGATLDAASFCFCFRWAFLGLGLGLGFRVLFMRERRQLKDTVPLSASRRDMGPPSLVPPQPEGPM